MKEILIIEDDLNFSNVLKRLLCHLGYKVITALDGLNAISILKDKTPDLIIADILIGDYDGIEIIKNIRQNALACKIIAISGGGKLGPDTYLQAASNVGADYVLAKPFNLNDFTSIIDEALKEKAMI